MEEEIRQTSTISAKLQNTMLTTQTPFALQDRPDVKRPPSRKHDRLPIQRPPIRPDPLPPKPLLHDNPARLIEAHPPQSHHAINLILRPLVQPAPRIPGFDVLRQVERRGLQAGLGVFGEARGRGQADVAEAVDPAGDIAGDVVDGCWDRARRGDVGDRWGVGFPLVSREVKDWRTVFSVLVDTGRTVDEIYL